MAKNEIIILGLNELKLAIKRSPDKVASEARNFLTRGIAAYNRGIIRRPWRIGSTGGGSPVSNDPSYPRRNQKLRSGNLRDTHIRKIDRLQAMIGPNLTAAPYAVFVHKGTNRMQARPWLDYVYREKAPEIERLYRGMLKNITKDLSK